MAGVGIDATGGNGAGTTASTDDDGHHHQVAADASTSHDASHAGERVRCIKATCNGDGESDSPDRLAVTLSRRKIADG